MDLRPGLAHAGRAFTLIELLVAIAIIGVLIGILLPALGAARNSGRKAVSLSNCRQLGNSTGAYTMDNRDSWPMRPSPDSWSSPTKGGFSSWSFGGNNCDEYWEIYSELSFPKGIYDEWAARRPLNAWVYAEMTFDLGESSWTNDQRKILKMDVFRSPGDRMSFLRNFPNPAPEVAGGSYADVGTSYHQNTAWYADLLPEYNLMRRANGMRAITSINTLANSWKEQQAYFRYAGKRFVLGTGLQTSKLAWLYDQTADRVALAPPGHDQMGEFGEVNRSVMAFTDGHAGYITMTPAAITGDNYQLSPAATSAR